MTTEQLLAKLEAAWLDFQDSYKGLTEEQMLEPGVTGNWSVKDIIAHVTWWEEEALIHLPQILRGERLPRYRDKYGGINAFNALMTERKKKLTLAEVFEEQRQTHERLTAYIKNAPPEQIKTETRFRRRLRLDAISHYPLHAQAVRNWRIKRKFEAH